MQYFNNISDITELRKLYYKLALQHHPDKGGSEEIMKAINNEYETATKNIINGNAEFSTARKVYETEVSEELQEKINKIIHFTDLIIEIIGGWIWISGNTYEKRKEIKEAGFKFSKNKTAWYWHSSNYRKRSKKQFSMDGIRNLWGAQTVETEQQTTLAIS